MANIVKLLIEECHLTSSLVDNPLPYQETTEMVVFLFALSLSECLNYANV